MTQTSLDISVIICAYTEERWYDLLTAVESVHRQTYPVCEIIVVVDHNPALLRRAQTHLPDVTIIENGQQRGLSGARNSGVAIAQGEVIAFMDEDALAAPDWLAHLACGYTNAAVMGVGGAIEPLWATEPPRWFPEEFGWVVGCTYRGLPATLAPVRNLIGCNMSFRRELFDAVGGFRHGMGRIGTRPVGCEETEICIRAGQHWPQRQLLYNPSARVTHRVPSWRACWTYFRQRCYAEGLSKAQVTWHVGASDGLAAENAYVRHTLPQGVWRGLTDAARGDGSGLARSVAIFIGLAITTFGYLAGKLIGQNQRRTMTSHQGNPSSALYATPGAEPNVSSFQPARSLTIELSQPIPDLASFDPERSFTYQRALVLVRLHTRPLGVVELNLARDLSATEVAQKIWRTLGVQIVRHLQEDGLPAVSELTAAGLTLGETPHCLTNRALLGEVAPFVSVVVATHDRTASLATTLDSLLALAYPTYEIMVVDNAPSSNATADLIRQRYGHLPQVRYVREDRPGLAVAHNRGLQEVTAPIVAFTDDDVVVDRHWLTALVESFALADDVGCVTGMIAPAELETPAQGWIEQFGFSKGFQRRIFDLAEHRLASPLYPYAAGTFGSGANMAFRSAVLRLIGGFDPALGAGSLAMGGDDLAAFFQVIVHGYKLVYEPAAILHHWHRREYTGLRRQAYGYGVGLTAFLTKTLVDKPTRLLDFARKAPHGLLFARKLRSTKHMQHPNSYPPELTTLERKGMLYGPLAYLRSRWRTRQWRTTPAIAQYAPRTTHHESYQGRSF